MVTYDLGVVMGHGPSGLFTAQLGPYIFLAQNCIRLESGLFKARSLNFIVQNVGPFTTPTYGLAARLYRDAACLASQGLLF